MNNDHRISYLIFDHLPKYTVQFQSIHGFINPINPVRARERKRKTYVRFSVNREIRSI